MRASSFLLGLLVLSTAAIAADVEPTATYIGWGGEGEQVFRSMITLARNNMYSDRNTLLVVDDLKRRGARLGVQRFTVEYTGGDDASENLLTAIHKKPYEYMLVRVYDTPQSPRMARVVMPRAKNVKATFRFFRNPHRDRATGVIDKGLIPELTRTIDTSTVIALPPINPLRDPSIRKPRAGEPAGPDTNAVAAIETTPSTDVASDAAQPAEARATMADIGTGGAPINANDPRLERTREFAKQMVEEQKGEQNAGIAAPDYGPGNYGPTNYAPLDYGPAAVPGDAKEVKMMGVPIMDDTPEMRAAEQRAKALKAKLDLENFQK